MQSKAFADALEPIRRLIVLGLCFLLLTLLLPAVFGQESSAPKTPPDNSLLTAGHEIEAQIEAGKVHSYWIDLRASQYVNIVITEDGPNLIAILLGPNGNELTKVEALETSRFKEISWIAETSGSYQLLIRPAVKAQPGRYRVRVAELRVASRRDKQSFTKQNELQKAVRLDEQVEKFFSEANYKSAIDVAQQSLEIRKRNLSSHDLLVAESLHNLAMLYLTTSDYTKAEPLFRQSLEIRERKLGKEDLLVSSSLNSLAGLVQGLGDYDAAETLFKRALTIRQARLGPMHLLVAQSMNNLGLLYLKKKEYQKAEKLFTEAYENLKKSLGHENNRTIANLLNNLAIVFQEQGDLTKAEPLYQHALKIQDKVFGAKHPVVAKTLHNLAVLYLLKKDFARAEPMYERAINAMRETLGTRHPDFANALESIGIMYQAKGDIDKAIESFTEASNIHDKNLSLIIAVGSEQQKRLYMDTLDMQTNVAISLHIRSAPQSVAASQLALTTILRRKGRVLDAMADSIEALRRRAKPEDREVLDHLSAVRSQLARLILNGPDPRNREQYDIEVARLENEIQRLEASISEQSAKIKHETQPITLESAQQAIPPDSALIEISTFRPFDSAARIKSEASAPPSYVAYVLRREGAPEWVELGDVAQIEKSVAAFREVLATPTRDVRQAARMLDEQIMRPIRKLLGSTTNVFLSTDRALNLLPFAALIDENNRFLVENYRITYLTSGRDLLRLHEVGPAAENRPVAFANPAFNHRQSQTRQIGFRNFQPLPGTAQEAQSLKKILPRLLLLTGAEATEGAIKRLRRPQILHVATHGFFLADQQSEPAKRNQLSSSKENPLLRSGLVLAGANQRAGGAGEDGILTALEASGLDLSGTKVVVLSACETGVGDVRNGDGVYGLRRALVLAGAESQVISLWKVDDDATKDLMIEFYKKLELGVGRTEALRQVQLSMLRSAAQKTQRKSRGAEIVMAETGTTRDASRSHPYYWAGFIQSGDWRSLVP